MLIDELRLQLKEIEPDLELIKTFYEKTNIDQQYKELDEIVHAENFWQNQNQIDLSKKYQRQGYQLLFPQRNPGLRNNGGRGKMRRARCRP